MPPEVVVPQGVSQPEGHSPPNCPLRHHGKSAVPPHKLATRSMPSQLYHYMRGTSALHQFDTDAVGR